MKEERLLKELKEFNDNYGKGVTKAVLFCLFVFSKVKNKMPELIPDDIDTHLNTLYELEKQNKNVRKLLKAKKGNLA